MTKKITLVTLLITIATSLLANQQADTVIVYKTINDIELSMHIFYPPNHKATEKTTALVFFHGGGWVGGGPGHFFPQCAYFASRGLVTMSAQYRTKNANGTTPIECVKDAKSAMRWVYNNAKELGVNRKQILAGGGSAGGHLAAAMALVDGFNEEGEKTKAPTCPKALVLFNPVANNGPDGYGYDRVKDYGTALSPYHNLDEKTPPTLIMLGTEDKLFTPAMAKDYKTKMEELGKRCDLILYPNQDHSFFNKDKNEKLHYQTMIDADKFLISLGFLSGKPATLEEFYKPLNTQ